ncbi:alpha/beta hydrolase [Nocardioides sp. zg-1308]|uniref:alpha/beta fold hydrolase n=1 Tax=Nocardioides TaxID=1839 RepID=UPI0015556E1D|nr:MULTISPECIES: alpha/beta hydrolase [unclassified Nocardioides]NPD05921.1 alpha/beta hydrolase [Nocardioides sp. zg-1308]WQQ23793.1 alpha/beta hydrolase [Nocardioides sp. S-34]
MTEHLRIGDNTLAYDVSGDGPLVVLAHGIGDSRHSYRFLAPALVDAGYRVANLDIRGCGESSLGWDGYSRTDIAGDLVALVRHLGGGPAVVVGHSISGGAATVAAATAPDLVAGVVELSPFTRAQSYPLGAMLTNTRYRRGATSLIWTMVAGSLSSWKKYLDLAYPAKPADWDAELARIDAKLREPGRMKALQAMTRTKPTDAGAQLAHVRCPVLVVEGSLDPDWADPRAEGQAIVDELAAGLGELVVLDGVGHYPHAQAPDELLASLLPFVARVVADA